MDQGFFDDSTLADINAALCFFADILVSPHEKPQSYQVVDEVTGGLTTENIAANDSLLHICGNNVPTTGPRIDAPATTRVYQPYPAQITFPPSGTDRIESVQFAVDNIDRALVDVVRRLEHPMRINIAVGYARARSPTDRTTAVCSVIEHRMTGLSLQQVTITPQVISGTLIVDDVLWRKYPNNNEIYKESNFPGLFGLGQNV